MATGSTNIAFLPVLSRGRHRNLQRGACFMEYASHLAGLSWSDHPDCTHPLLALVAREVNDETSDAARADLAPMIPSVIGVTPDDPRLVPALVARCVRLVVPVVSRQFQRNLAAAVLTAEYVLAEMEGRPAGEVRAATAEVLAGVPEAVEWATQHLESRARPYAVGYEWEAPLAVAGAIRAVSDFRVPAGDALLRQLLGEAIEECRAWMSPLPERTATCLPVASVSR